MAHVYSNEFYDYIDLGARRSAQEMIRVLKPALEPTSVLDLGSGRGVWLGEWAKAGATDVIGVDGDYVDRDQLAIERHQFQAADLTAPLALGRRFDLAQSLEVGEHLPEAASGGLVDTLTGHSDIVLFSAAVPGQGGEFHINEKPLSYWQDLFSARGFDAFDCIRPQVRTSTEMEPWYRYNSVLYANAAGQARLSKAMLDCRVTGKVPLAGSLGWRLRRTVVSLMPQPMVTKIAQVQASILARQARKAQA